MKKVFILTSILLVFLVTGCSDDSSSDSGIVDEFTPNVPLGCSDDSSSDSCIDLTDPVTLKSLEGTYNIEFFYVDAKVETLTTDCSMVATYIGAEAKKCNKPDTDGVKHKGQATIKVNDNGSVKVISKVQINGGVFDTSSIIQSVASDKTYNFTEFPTVPSSAISKTTINAAAGNDIKGTYGRSAKTLVDETKSDKNTFNFTVAEDGIVVSRVTDKTVMPADTVIRMKKTSNDVIELDPNTPYDTPVIDNFSQDIKYKLKNN